MKKMIMALAILSSLNALAEDPQRIICHEDLRLNNGPMREIILTTDANNNYFVQTSFVASLSTPDIVIEKWATDLSCRIDEKMTVAFCQNKNASSTVQIKERREIYFDSLDDDTKRKTDKSVDISLQENGAVKKTLSFAAADCSSFGGTV